MKRTSLHVLNQESARKRINAAKSNKPFMAALLDRSHRGHNEALAHWTRLHEVAFEGPKDRPMRTPRGGANPSDLGSTENELAEGVSLRRAGSQVDDDHSRTTAVGSSSVRRSANAARTLGSRKAGSRKQRADAGRPGDGQGPEQLLPDPERPLNVDQQAISPLLRRQGESEPDWSRRLLVAASGVQMSAEQLTVIREAILQEIGFYEVGSRKSTSNGELTDSDWRVLAVLQNVPIEGWDRAERMDGAQSEFEQRGTLGQFEVIGPDGNLYHRSTILGSNPVGDVLQTIDSRIHLLQPPPSHSVLSMLPLVRQANPSRQGGTPPRGLLAANVAPRVHQVIRARRAAANVGLGIGLAGIAAMQQSGRFDMDRAPGLPPLPGFEPPEEPETEESFDEASIEVEVVPGFEVPEPEGPKVLIFPDVSEEILRTMIIERRERQETRDQIDAVRDFYLQLHPDWKHHAGGRPVGSSTDRKEFRIEGPGVAFEDPITGRPGDSRPGSIYVDLTFETPEGLVHIQTVDIDRDGLPTDRELRTARRLADVTGRPVYLIPKIWQLREIEERDSDFFPIEMR